MKKLSIIVALFAASFIANANTFSPLTTGAYETTMMSGRISAFCMAIVKGDFETVKKLVDMGADVNEASKNGITPLMYAARYNKVDILNLLIENGANLKAKNPKNGFTALRYAELSNATEAYNILENALGS
ncbi:MAG: ankyrin repeat domain-containing protein [Bacteroidota bacterium]